MRTGKTSQFSETLDDSFSTRFYLFLLFFISLLLHHEVHNFNNNYLKTAVWLSFSTHFELPVKTVITAKQYPNGQQSQWLRLLVLQHPEGTILAHHSLVIIGIFAPSLLSPEQIGSPVNLRRKENDYFLSPPVIHLHRFRLEPLYNRAGLWEEAEAVYVEWYKRLI